MPGIATPLKNGEISSPVIVLSIKTNSSPTTISTVGLAFNVTVNGAVAAIASTYKYCVGEITGEPALVLIKSIPNFIAVFSAAKVIILFVLVAPVEIVFFTNCIGSYGLYLATDIVFSLS